MRKKEEKDWKRRNKNEEEKKRKERGGENMKKYLPIALSALLISGILSGCNNGGKVSDIPSEQSPSIETPSVMIPSEAEPSEQTPSITIPSVDVPSKSENGDTQMEKSSKNQISAYITDKIYETEKGNVLFSPLSLDVAIGMVANVSEGETKNDINKFLKTDDYNAFMKSYNEYIKNNLNTGKSNDFYTARFELANSIWIDDGLDINKDSRKSYKEVFDAQIKNVPMTNNPEKAANEINKWCEEKTHKLISKIVKPDSIANKTAVLANSLYFESPWVDEWYDTGGEFKNIDGTTSKLPLMEGGANAYYENEQATAFSKRYSNGMYFIGILPKQDGDFTIQDLNIDTLLASKNANDYDVIAKMPSELNYASGSDALSETLQSIGLTSPFDSHGTEITKLLDNGQQLYIDSIIQKTKIELDKNGTKAAAVTAVMMDNCAAVLEPKEIKEVILDKPFAYLIYDEANNQIVFMGKVTTLE